MILFKEINKHFIEKDHAIKKFEQVVMSFCKNFYLKYFLYTEKKFFLILVNIFTKYI